ncbi:N-acetylglucosamine 6-phosphate deacetylase [Bacillus oleivorans]|uniref:N-acetylglucosamine-6-phosphate deacetylase n=1 Tax=Bacillus oleivorans TaxID=1448271 RepID=A0A285CYI8_9BACI|nr:N-acetylglucosamine-6-phosphate deacetylase [Bacillus oleivorans]SNX72622.1 N-acetylglucosamine 6-phosphate deacetylase [Bacillus oleivorans]
MFGSKEWLLINGEIYTEEKIIENGYIHIAEGIIQAVGPMETAPSHIENQFDANGQKVVPGFIDVHIHGVGGADTMDASNEAYETMARTLPQEGTTSFLATTATQSIEAIEKALQAIALYRKSENKPGKAEMAGVHLEGPFLHPDKAGAQHPSFIQEPNMELFEKWRALSDDSIRLVTLAPERPNGYQLVEYLKSNGIIASIGHSNAAYDEVKQAIGKGLSHVTHLYNAMRPLHHRDPGVVGAALLHRELTAEIIADGIHVHPKMIEHAIQSKGTDRIVLITDSMRAKCLKNGIYDLGGQEVKVEGRKATLADGTLAGSVLKMKDAVKLIVEDTSFTLVDSIQFTSVNPAKELGLYERKGSLSSGKDADIVVLNQKLDVVLTVCRGEISYNKEG